jgi:S1-C subfamily serine protease
VVPAQCLERTVRLRTASGSGTGFVIELHGRQWLVTARHVVEGTDARNIEVVRDSKLDVTLTPVVPGVAAGADIAVFALDSDITPNHLTLHVGSDGLVVTQDAYFLGYPYGLGMLEGAGSRTPFVKKGIVSAFHRPGGIAMWYLDGINNPGFSGGPVVFNRQGTKDWHVMSVVSAYRTEPIAVAGAAGFVPVNTGIVVSYDIRHAVEAIDAFV